MKARKKLIDIIIVTLSVYAFFLVFLYFKQNSMLFFPPALSIVNITPLEHYERIEVQTKDGLRIQGYFHAPQKSFPVILAFHGNGSHPAWEEQKFRRLFERGYGVLLAEYRGYGGNAGSPDEQGLYLDGQAYMDWIKKNHAGQDIVLYGASLGSGVAVELAKNNPDIASLVLEVTFDNIPSVAATHYPFVLGLKTLTRNKFLNDEKIQAVQKPKLFMLAGQDNVIPVALGKRLYELAEEPKELHIFEEAKHNNVYAYGAAEILDNFLKKNVK